ncbi:MAG: hypothetical protein WD294_09105 [Phycisphaeraceae bacterium]
MTISKRFTGFAVAAAATFALTAAPALGANANSVISGLVNEGLTTTGNDAVKIGLRDQTWTFAPPEGSSEVTGGASELGEGELVQAMFRIEQTGWSTGSRLDPAPGSFDGSGSQNVEDYGIFGTLSARVVSAWDGSNRIELDTVSVNVRTIDNANAPTVDTSDDYTSASTKFTTLGDFAISFFDDIDDFYRLKVDTDASSNTFGKVIGFEFGLTLDQQDSLPPVVARDLALGGSIVGQFDIFGEGTFSYDGLSGDAEVLTGADGSRFHTGNANFSTFMTPTPAAAGPGLIALGLLAAYRRRRDAAEMA